METGVVMVTKYQCVLNLGEIDYMSELIILHYCHWNLHSHVIYLPTASHPSSLYYNSMHMYVKVSRRVSAVIGEVTVRYLLYFKISLLEPEIWQ